MLLGGGGDLCFGEVVNDRIILAEDVQDGPLETEGPSLEALGLGVDVATLIKAPVAAVVLRPQCLVHLCTCVQEVEEAERQLLWESRRRLWYECAQRR